MNRLNCFTGGRLGKTAPRIKTGTGIMYTEICEYCAICWTHEEITLLDVMRHCADPTSFDITVPRERSKSSGFDGGSRGTVVKCDRYAQRATVNTLWTKNGTTLVWYCMTLF